MKNPVGRPKGSTKPKNLLESSAVLEAFQRLRAAGNKHDLCIDLTVEEMKQRFPELKTCATDVKTLLAEFMPADSPGEMLKVTRVPGMDIPGRGFVASEKAYALGFSERPNYPRANAPKSPAKRPKPGK